mgnify:CR=1 FL=1
MALLDKLTTAGSNLSGLNGGTPSIPNFAGSKLDLNGDIPASNYRDNAPEGRTF